MAVNECIALCWQSYVKKAKKPVPTKELPKKRTDAEKVVEDDGSLFDIVRSNKTALSVSYL